MSLRETRLNTSSTRSSANEILRPSKYLASARRKSSYFSPAVSRSASRRFNSFSNASAVSVQPFPLGLYFVVIGIGSVRCDQLSLGAGMNPPQILIAYRWLYIQLTARMSISAVISESIPAIRAAGIKGAEHHHD